MQITRRQLFRMKLKKTSNAVLTRAPKTDLLALANDVIHFNDHCDW
jgi:hypothetical protein